MKILLIKLITISLSEQPRQVNICLANILSCVFSLSEPECRVITELTNKKQFDAFISFHSGKREIVFPTIGRSFTHAI